MKKHRSNFIESHVHEAQTFFQKVVASVKAIPRGKVATYGQIAALSGNPQAARGVAWILHSSSGKYSLPWHRVVNRLGKISLPPGEYEEQKALLESEGVRFAASGKIDFDRFLWQPLESSK